MRRAHASPQDSSDNVVQVVFSRGRRVPSSRAERMITPRALDAAGHDASAAGAHERRAELVPRGLMPLRQTLRG